MASPVEPSERLNEVYRQLAGIGGGRSLGFGPNRVRSLPDGLAQALEEYLRHREERLLEERQRPAEAEYTPLPLGNGKVHIDLAPSQVAPQQQPPLLKTGDLCPECGMAAVVNEEGCRKCYACGYSEC
jgi:ribonucleoside-diphosphate reductase alpha chain